jgi:hypothetical protein
MHDGASRRRLGLAVPFLLLLLLAPHCSASDPAEGPRCPGTCESYAGIWESDPQQPPAQSSCSYPSCSFTQSGCELTIRCEATGAGLGELQRQALTIHESACIEPNPIFFGTQDRNACAFALAAGAIQGTCKGCPFFLLPRAATDAGARDAAVDAAR